MNLDDIKNVWDKEEGGDIKVPQDLSSIQAAQGPLDRIKKNMKYELYVQIASLVFLGLMPFYLKFRAELMLPFFALYAVMLAISVYFLLKYYFYYKQLSNHTLNSKDHLYALYYDLRLNMEMYKSFAYSLMPFLLIFTGMMVMNAKKDLVISSTVIYIAVGSYIGIMVLISAATSAWVNSFYGRYAKQIKALLDELKED